MENFGNFTVYAKDREAAGVVCLMKGMSVELLCWVQIIMTSIVLLILGNL